MKLVTFTITGPNALDRAQDALKYSPVGLGAQNVILLAPIPRPPPQTCFNEFSACDEQAKEMAGELGPGKGKEFDNANAMRNRVAGPGTRA